MNDKLHEMTSGQCRLVLEEDKYEVYMAEDDGSPCDDFPGKLLITLAFSKTQTLAQINFKDLTIQARNSVLVAPVVGNPENHELLKRPP